MYGFWLVSVPVLFWLLLFLLLDDVGLFILIFILFRAHVGYLQVDRALYRLYLPAKQKWSHLQI